jgi:hypothetical protein
MKKPFQNFRRAEPGDIKCEDCSEYLPPPPGENKRGRCSIGYNYTVAADSTCDEAERRTPNV